MSSELAVSKAPDKAIAEMLPMSVRQAITPVSRSNDAWVPTVASMADFFQIGECPKEDLLSALQVLQASCAPVGVKPAIAAMSQIRMMTVPRNMSENELAAQVKVYAEQCQSYPADIVVKASQHICRTSKWFPAWKELAEIMDALSSQRRRLKSALEAKLNKM